MQHEPQFSDYLKRLAQGVGEGMSPDANPFVMEGGTQYLRFDAIKIRPGEDRFGGALVDYCWRGEVMCTLRIEGAKMIDGAELHMHGIEGKMRVNVIA